jgi:hypothetical protein
MKKYILSITAVGILASSFLLSSCEKSKPALAPTESYKLIGRIEPTLTSIPTATLIKAEFIITFNSPNSFGEGQSVLNGNLALSGYTGITGRDTVSFFGLKSSGPPATSYITAANTAIGTTNTNLLYNYFNGAAATFNVTNYPFTNDITATLKEGGGFFRIGQYPKYVYVLLDNVTKL